MGIARCGTDKSVPFRKKRGTLLPRRGLYFFGAESPEGVILVTDEDGGPWDDGPKEKEVAMVCAKCGKEGIDPGDAFCRHCGVSIATATAAPECARCGFESKPAMAADSDGGKGLQILGGTIFVLAALLAPAVAVFVGLPNFGASVLPWVAGSLMMVGLGMAFIGTRLRHAH